jgi:hypothetical protein
MAYIFSVQNTGTTVYNGFTFTDAAGNIKTFSLQPNLVYYLNSGGIPAQSPPILLTQLNKTDETYCLSGCCNGELISVNGLTTSPVFSSATIGEVYYINYGLSSSGSATYNGCYELVNFGNNQNIPPFTCNDEFDYISVISIDETNIYAHCVLCLGDNPCLPTPTPTPTPTVTPFLTPTPTPTPTQSQTPQTGVTTTTTTNNIIPIPIPINPKNECDVITIYPMGIKCLGVDPSTDTSFDGLLTLIITGGTPPYQINWGNNNISTVLTNLNVGEYPVTVTDYYNDFTVSTICTLTASTVTTTTTINPVTTTTTTLFDNILCLTYVESISTFNLQTNSYVIKETIYQEELYFDGLINNQPSLVSSGGTYTLFWNTGLTSNWVIDGPFDGQFVNSNSVTPPTIGWQIVGSFLINSVSVVIGPCLPQTILKFKVSKNDPVCGNDGSIQIEAINGVPPYEYSIDGGINYQTSPFFVNLAPGNYIVSTRDTVGNEVSTSISLQPSNITVYTLTLSLDVNTNSFTISLDNPLPAGATISFTLDQQSIFKYWKRPIDIVPTYDCVVTVNGYGPLPIITGNGSVIPALNGCPPLFTGIQEIYERSATLVITNNDIITGTYTDDIFNPPVGFCKNSSLSMTLAISVLSVDNCDCCEILVSNPPKKIF